MKLKSVVNLTFSSLFSIFTLLILGIYAFTFKAEKSALNAAALIQAKSILQANLPELSEDLAKSNIAALKPRMNLLVASNRSKGLNLLVLDENLDSLFNSIPAGELKKLLTGRNLNDDFNFAIDGRAFVSRPVVVGLKKIGTAVVMIENSSESITLINKIFVLSISVGSLAFLIIFLGTRIYLSVNLLTPVEQMIVGLKAAEAHINLGEPMPLPPNTKIKEFEQLSDAIANFATQLRKSTEDRLNLLKENTYAQASSDLAKQLAHDIRSPLSTLNSIKKRIEIANPEVSRLLFLTIERINEIAETMLNKNRVGANKHHNSQPIAINDLISDIVFEKSAQFFNDSRIKIETLLEDSLDVKINVDSTELKRAISNLINNSIDSFEGKGGALIIQTKVFPDIVTIILQDNGCGIPAEIINRIGEKGFTHGKERGNGLGLSHAKVTLKTFGGDLKISSTLHVGTQVEMILPRS